MSESPGIFSISLFFWFYIELHVECKNLHCRCYDPNQTLKTPLIFIAALCDCMTAKVDKYLAMYLHCRSTCSWSMSYETKPLGFQEGSNGLAITGVPLQTVCVPLCLAKVEGVTINVQTWLGPIV